MAAPKLRVALKIAGDAGCVVEKPNRTGEVRVTCPCGKARLTMNARRKDAPVALLLLLKHLERDHR